MKSSVRLALSIAAAMTSAATASAAQVAELKPADVAAFVARHPVAVVQSTSPDRKCGYCVGADKAFDRAAAADKAGKYAYARVQHTPWRAIPDFGNVMHIYGVPTSVVFKDGKRVGVLGGAPDANPERYLDKIEVLLANPPAPPADAAPAAAAAPSKSLSADDNAAVHAVVRRDLLKGVLDVCAQRFPAGAGNYKKALAQWEAPRKALVGQGTVLLLTGDTDPKSIVEEEQKSLQAWQTKELGITNATKVDAASCDRVAAGLASLK